MRICNLKSFVLGIMLLTVCMAWSQAGAVEIKYQFTKGENTQYRLSFSNNITVHAEQTKSDVMTHSYTFTEKVMRERPAGFSLDLSFDEVQYRPGKGTAEFDSRNSEHRSIAAAGQNKWRTFGAIATSEAKLRVTLTGEVSFFRLKSVGPEYDDEKTKFYVERMIEEVKDCAFLMFPPEHSVDVGGTLPTFIPIRMVGPLAGNTTYATADLVLNNVETVNGERRANFSVKSFGQANLEMEEDSIQGVNLDLNVSSLKGTLVFSLDKGQIVNYDFQIKTVLKISSNGQVVQQHMNDIDFSLNRL